MRDANVNKQSQFPATPGGTGPAGRGPWAVVQTNPISGGVPSLKCQAGREGQVRQTKPNLGKLGYLRAGARLEPMVQNKANCGRPGGRDIPLFHYSTIPSFQCRRRRLCQTNPIARSGAPRRCPAGPGGARGVVQTNPIPALVPIRRSAFPGHPPYQRGNCAKQTQFSPPGGQAGRRVLGVFPPQILHFRGATKTKGPALRWAGP